MEMISTHAPRVRRDSNAPDAMSRKEISTHAPRVRRDSIPSFPSLDHSISTHAPRVRRDSFKIVYNPNSKNFYSRASCEARPPGLHV